MMSKFIYFAPKKKKKAIGLYQFGIENYQMAKRLLLTKMVTSLIKKRKEEPIKNLFI